MTSGFSLARRLSDDAGGGGGRLVVHPARRHFPDLERLVPAAGRRSGRRLPAAPPGRARIHRFFQPGASRPDAGQRAGPRAAAPRSSGDAGLGPVARRPARRGQFLRGLRAARRSPLQHRRAGGPVSARTGADPHGAGGTEMRRGHPAVRRRKAAPGGLRRPGGAVPAGAGGSERPRPAGRPISWRSASPVRC